MYSVLTDQKVTHQCSTAGAKKQFNKKKKFTNGDIRPFKSYFLVSNCGYVIWPKFKNGNSSIEFYRLTTNNCMDFKCAKD